MTADAKLVDTELLEVALFPIPNAVAFPGVDLPLHVFEPRYRSLVKDCVEHNRMLGVCHTVKAIHQPSEQKKNLEEMLNSNQTTYKPQAVFSAGECEILETLPDGRMLTNVKVSRRLEIVDELQSLPYRIVHGRPLPDKTAAGAVQKGDEILDIEEALKTRVHQRFTALVAPEDERLAEALADETWLKLTPAAYSFQIFSCLRFDADVMQHILELRSPRERLQTLWQLLGQAANS